MIRLIKIELAKLTPYRTFWILIVVFMALMVLVPMSGMEVLKSIKLSGTDLGGFDATKIPLYHFPDIWQNLTYFSKFINLILGILVIIIITNEFAFKTIRQNVIDGMSRADFIGSKVLFILGLSILSTLFVLAIGLIMGSYYSPESEMRFMFKHIDFVFAFFLFTLNFLLFSMVIALLIKRAGMSIVLLLIYPIIESILRGLTPEFMMPITAYFPFTAISNLIDFPLLRYAAQEIRDAVELKDILLNLIYIPLLIGLGYQTISKKNLT